MPAKSIAQQQAQTDGLSKSVRWRLRNPGKAKAQRLRWYQKHIEKLRQKAREKYWRNRESSIAANRRWKERNPDKLKLGARRSLLRKYGLTLEMFEIMCLQQKGRCAVCGARPKLLCVDHNHKTGRVRKLLCGRCNTIVGIVENSPVDVLDKVTEYLRAHACC